MKQARPLAYALAVLLVAAASIIVSDHIYNIPANNGDYARAVSYILPNMRKFEPPEACKLIADFSPETFLPRSSMTVFVALLASAAKLFGARYFCISYLFVTLSVIYWIGVGLAALTSDGGHARRALIIVSCAVNYLVFSFYFKSFYEETVVLLAIPWLLAAPGMNRPYIFDVLFALVCGGVLFAKPQMIFMAPPLLYVWFRRSQNRLAGGVLALSVGLFFVLPSGLQVLKTHLHWSQKPSPAAHQHPPSGSINAYDRVFNGVGWSIQNVGNWPASTFQERLAYFAANKDRLQESARTVLSTDAHSAMQAGGLDLVGTSYWDEGFNVIWGSDDNAKKIKEETSLSSYFRLLSNPKILGLYLYNIYLVAKNSNYDVIHYVKYYNYNNGNPMLEFGQRFISMFNSSLWLKFSIACVLAAIACARWDVLIVSLYICLGAPVFSVLGDGYCDFEKHLLPYVMFFPFIFFSLPALGASSVNQVDPSTKTDLVLSLVSRVRPTKQPSTSL